jgi:hypothetical protein
VIVGPVLELLRRQDPALLEWLEQSQSVLFHPYRASIDEFGLAGSFDFYYRAYGDLSVPYSVYSAALARKPILTLRTGFLGEMVERYGLGAVLETDLSNLPDAIRSIDVWNPVNSSMFLNSHTWDEGARRLLMACDVVPQVLTEW